MIDNVLNRLHMKRGTDLPHAKLNDDKVREIRAIVDERNILKEKLKTMSNAAMAKQYGVHIHTIERITSGENWGHVLDRLPETRAGE